MNSDGNLKSTQLRKLLKLLKSSLMESLIIFGQESTCQRPIFLFYQHAGTRSCSHPPSSRSPPLAISTRRNRLTGHHGHLRHHYLHAWMSSEDPHSIFSSSCSPFASPPLPTTRPLALRLTEARRHRPPPLEPDHRLVPCQCS
jgi:hypothetical protein